jgi:MFS family permease
MTLSKARWTIFTVWGIAIVLYTLMFHLAPSIRGGVISDSQANTGMWKILALVSPVLGAYVGFYFSPEKKKLRTGTIAKDRWRAAFWITIAYHGLLMVFLVNVLFFHDYRGSENGVGHQESSFEDLIANTLQWGVYFSVFATGPVAYLVGNTKIELPQGDSSETVEGSDE